ncbi:MAG: type II secretion system protein GspJ [Fuerstiella sp.]|nr:type II secretion system protein GspJ [Fuerstiella sp.]
MQVRRPTGLCTGVRHGFTLLETLLATALCSMLLIAAYSSIRLYWNYRVRSQDQIAGSARLLALIDDISTDLRAACPAPPDPPVQADFSDADTSADLRPEQINNQTDLPEVLILPGAVARYEPVHVAGGKDWLSVLAGQGSPRFPDAETSMELCYIVWCLNQGQSVSLPVNIQSVTDLSLSLSGLDHGLVRLKFPVTPGLQRDLITPEVTGSVIDQMSSIHFEYFDGSQWLNLWGKDQSYRCPDAVRMTCQFEDQTEVERTVTIRLPQSFSEVRGDWQ